jgi:two-component system sensor histidine kinase AlgZ
MLGPTDESIKQPPEALPGKAAPVSFQRSVGAPRLDAVEGPIPDWCNAGIGVRIIAVVNGAAMLIAAIMSSDILLWAATCLRFALILEPVLLTSLLLCCLVRPATRSWPVSAQIALVLLIPALATLAIETGLRNLYLSGPTMQVRDMVIAALVAACTLYWAQLRSQSHLPALAEARLAALQARIRPHFLFNSLNAVLGLIRSDPKRAETLLEDLADLFRVLMRDHHERVSLADELAVCRKYLEIERLRLGARLIVHLAIDPRAESAQVPLLLLQPLIENAVLHGIEPSSSVGVIEVRAERRGNVLEIVISNPWNGDDARRGHQIGLANVRQRLELLHDLEATLDTRVHHERYEVHMRLPYIRAHGMKE